MTTRKIPASFYGAEHDGLLDPDRYTPQERATRGTDRLDEELARRRSPSLLIRALQAATDRAFGRKGGR